MYELTLDALSTAELVKFAEHPVTLIRSGIKERCDALGLAADKTRQAQQEGLAHYPGHSVAWCICQGVAEAYSLACGRRAPIRSTPGDAA